MMYQKAGHLAFVLRIRSFGSLLEVESSGRDLMSSFQTSALALRSRIWHLIWAAKMSFVSFAMEEVTVAGVESSLEIMETDRTLLEAVVSGEDDDKDRSDLKALALWETGPRAAEMLEEISENGAGASTAAIVWNEVAYEGR